MLTALIGGEIINCYDGTHTKEQLKKWSKKKILLCPACGKPYEYCHGHIKDPYFRHMEKEECKDKYSESETEEHLVGKRDLYEWIKKQDGVTNVILEAWIPETKQRPDIMFEYNDKKYVIEYQCSPIASEYIERHELYKTAGICDIWICGTEKYLGDNKRLNTLETCCKLYYDTKSKALYKMDSMDVKEFSYLSKLREYRYEIKNR
ncbi:competence protein CoiA, partial [Lachnospiraceae bacterium SGI.054]